MFPPNSKIDLPKRCATVAPTILPIRVDPVAEIKGTRLSFVIHSPTLKSPFTKAQIPSGKSLSFNTSAIMFWQATPHIGAFSEGFQMHTFPQIHAKAVFQAQTATGKLNAEIIPTIPKGWYWSYILCPGRSECMVIPFNWRERPTAKSQISIISCTSPKPSWYDFPIS